MAKKQAIEPDQLLFADVVIALDRFCRIVSEWEQGSGPKVPYQGAPRKAVSEAVQDGIINLAKFVNHNNFDPGAYEIVMAIDQFVDAACEWAAAAQKNPADTDPIGSTKMWHLLEVAKQHMSPRTWKRVEPVAELMRLRNMSAAQICKIYGWFDDEGRSQEWKVTEEMAAPGTHFDPNKWINPNQIAFEKKLKERWDVRCQRDHLEDPSKALKPKKEETTIDRSKWRDPGIAPEPVEELLRLQGITFEQIAAMKKIPIEEVRQIAISCRIPVDASVMTAIANNSMELARAKIDQETEIITSRLNTYRELDALEDRIWSMMDDGHNPGLILQALKPERPDLTYSAVVAIGSTRPTAETVVKEPENVSQTGRAAAKSAD